MQLDERVAGEVRAFGAAVEQRFGKESVRTMLRGRGQSGVVAPSIAAEQQAKLDRVAELTVTLKAGERAAAGLTQQEAEQLRQGQRRGMRM